MSNKQHGTLYWVLIGWWWKPLVLWFKVIGWLIKGVFKLIAYFLEKAQEKRNAKNNTFSTKSALKHHDVVNQLIQPQPVAQFSKPNENTLQLHRILEAKAVTTNDYVVVDCETTGLELYDCITEIAAIKFKNNVEVDRYCTMVNPETLIPPHITSLTGITNDDVAQAPTFESIAEKLNAFLENLPIVAHNAQFDAKFLHMAFARARIVKSFDYIDTCDLARHTFPGLRKYKLQNLCQDLHITNRLQSHRAEDDAERAAKLFSLCKDAIINHLTVADIERRHQEYINSLVIHPKDFKPENRIDKTSPLYKKTIAFTGDFSVSRQKLAQQAVNAGAILRVSVTPTLNYLVVGKPNEAAVGYDGISRKEKNAHALIASGNTNLQLLSEESFKKMCPIWAQES